MNGGNYILLTSGVFAFGEGFSKSIVDIKVKEWRECVDDIVFILILAGSQTAEVQGISSAGATPESRRYTAVADAELLLRGPLGQKKWPLPPLLAGVSPVLL
jgi:NaMN:DMB phosphoribosyltransferase